MTAPMGLWGIERKVSGGKSASKLASLHRFQCAICPYNNLPGLKHPKMPATGSTNPIVYIIGEAPGETEDIQGEQFVGVTGKLLRHEIPREWLKHIRWNNVVRTRPPKNEQPHPDAIEACRPSVEADIANSKPRAIFGFGNVPLYWFTGQTGITNWRGRRLPVKVGSHTCWYYPMFHPSYVLRRRNDKGMGQEDEFVFRLDLKRAFDEIEHLPEAVVHDREMAMANIEVLTGGRADLATIENFMAAADDELLVGFDYETNRVRPYSDGAAIMSVGLALRDSALAFAVDHPQAEWAAGDRAALGELLADFLLKCRARKVVHALSFEMEWSAYFHGKDVLRAGKWGDSLSQAYILDERHFGSPGALSLDFLTLQYFGMGIKALSNVDRAKVAETELDTVLTYNAIDARYHRLLYIEQLKRLKAEELKPVYDEQLRRIPTFVLTQMKGIPLDQNKVNQLHDKYTKRLKTIEAEIEALPCVKKFSRIKHTFRPSANRDIIELLKLDGIRPDSVDETELSAIKHQISKPIIRWRKANKTLSTYILPLLPDSENVYPDGRLHPLTNATTTRTWRTSSEKPNYQNWPRRGADDEAKEVRGCVAVKSSFRLVSFDYGQIQARNVAMESRDAALIEAFKNRYDIHAAWTERLMKIHPRWVTSGKASDKAVFKKYRDRIKNEFVFPSFFGAQPKSLSSYLGVPINVAEQLSEEFWDQFRDIHAWQETTRENYRRDGYVSSLSGFRRHAPVDWTQVINSPIQADEAAIVCDAMCRLSELDHTKYQPNMEIHDSLEFVIPKDKVEERAEVIIREMITTPFAWAHVVPLTVEMKIGSNWSDLTEVGTFASDSWNGIVEIKVD